VQLFFIQNLNILVVVLGYKREKEQFTVIFEEKIVKCIIGLYWLVCSGLESNRFILLSSSLFYVHTPCQPWQDWRISGVAKTFCEIFFTFTKTVRRCGSTGQSTTLRACITAFWLVIEAKNLHRMYFLS